MNIRDAKQEIKNALRAYHRRDGDGRYVLSPVHQRPLLLMGPPGIGKTAVVEQAAREAGVGLVAYTMTHHTRQSAVGLPRIEVRTYQGRPVSVTEYTLSEIVASVYDCMERTGKQEGILFLDEINCVSETLSPSMLQFLQYKTFGKHRVPEGWIIVTAGNPPEYNKSVREFDVVTMDRLKVLEVEADYDAWKTYAREMGIHGAIVSFLELKKEYFYHIETTVKGRLYVTARGWEDLSQILYLYEEEKLPVSEALIGQYIRNDKIVKEFGAYYDLYQKYKKDYHVDEILGGTVTETIVKKAEEAPFDERLSLLGMLMDKMLADIKENMETGAYLQDMMAPLRAVKDAEDGLSMLDKQIQAREKIMQNLAKGGSLSPADKKKNKRILHFLEKCKKEAITGKQTATDQVFALIKSRFDEEVSRMKQDTELCQSRLSALFDFVEKAFSSGNEMLILVTELTVNNDSSRFIATFGCEAYQRQNKQLMLSERTEQLAQEIRELKL